MANKKFSDLDAAAPLTGAEIMAVSQGNLSKKTLLSTLRTFIAPSSTDAVPEGVNNKYFTAPRVLEVVLTGLSTASGVVIAATDTVLYAMGKLQRQASDLAGAVSLLAPKLAPALTNPTLNNPTFIGGSAGNIAGPLSLPMPDGHAGDITVTVVQNGIGASVWVIPFIKSGGVLTLGVIQKTFSPNDPISSASVVTSNLQISLVAANSYVTFAFSRRVALGT